MTWLLVLLGLRQPLHWGRVTHVGFSELGYHWFRWLGTWPALSHYLIQCWDIVNWTLRNKLQWNFNRNSKIFIQENAFKNVIWKMAAILSQPQSEFREMIAFSTLVLCFLNWLHRHKGTQPLTCADRDDDGRDPLSSCWLWRIFPSNRCIFLSCEATRAASDAWQQ